MAGGPLLDSQLPGFLQKKESHAFYGRAFFEQICLVMLLKQACLFEKLVYGIGSAVDLNAKAFAPVVKQGNVPHCPFYTALVEIDDISVFVVENLLFEVDGDVWLCRHYPDLYFAVDEFLDHLFGRRELPSAGSGNDLKLNLVVTIPFC